MDRRRRHRRLDRRRLRRPLTGHAIDALAIYRLWRLAAHDDITEGPRARFNSALWARARARHHEPGTPPTPKTIILLECPWCLGFWITAAVTAARTSSAGARAWDRARTPLAISALVGIIATATARLEQ
jgi:hypothetical protein